MIEEHIYNWQVPCTTNKERTDFYVKACVITCSGLVIDHVVRCETGYFGNIKAVITDKDGNFVLDDDLEPTCISYFGDVRITIDGELQP